MSPGARVVVGELFAREFRIDRLLAEGGMGSVYVAEQLSTGKPRALKVLHAEIVEDLRLREQFAQEARVGSLIGSWHIVDVVAAGVDDATGLPWLAMELLDGDDLSAVVERTERLAPELARTVFEQLGDALGAAHRAGVVHRDLKPENIFLARSTIRGVPFVVKVLDFGIARIIAQTPGLASTTRALGSPLWLAPEQAQPGAPLAPSTDVWSLGLLAYHVLTGRYFWRAANHEAINLTALLVEVTVEPLPEASTRATEQGVAHLLPEGFDAWFSCCVVRDPSHRFVDAAKACTALVGLLGHAPAVQSAPLSAPFFPARPVAPVAPVATVQGDALISTRAEAVTRPDRPAAVPEAVTPSLPASAPPPATATPAPRSRGRLVAIVALAVCVVTLGAALAWRALTPPTTCDEGAAAHCVAEGEALLAADLPRALERLQRACDLRELAGCVKLGDALARGRGRDAARAAVAYERACDGGALIACASLGRLLTDGRGVTRDRVRAARLFQRACDGHVAEGCVRLAIALRQGVGVVTQRDRAVQLLQQACRDDHFEGCFELGAGYLRGTSGAIDPVRAVSLLDRACAGGFGDACRLLGERYAQGRGVAADPGRATAAFRSARDHWRPECTNRRATACVGLADLLAGGQGGPVDGPGATGLYRWVADLYADRCDRRPGPSCAALAALYDAGQGVGADPQRAAALRERACEGGDSEVCVSLGDTYREGRGVAADSGRATALYLRAREAFAAPCDAGDLPRCLALGDLLRDGRGGAADPAQALTRYQQACAAGEQRGCARVGALLLAEGPLRDLARGETVLQTACDAGEPEACTALGHLRVDIQHAVGSVALFQRACDGGSPAGCRELAGAYLRGQSVAADIGRGLALLDRACVADDFEACDDLAGLLSGERTDVPPQRERARALRAVACRGGVAEACRR
jgi:TPR repeat protein/tRNA A-37 threonylcarbamoyl transferase component Bud32